MTDKAQQGPDEARVYTFAQGNPVGPGYWDVAALLRRVAETIDGIPNVRVDDLTFHSTPTNESEDLYISVYFHIADEEELERDRALGRV